MSELSSELEVVGHREGDFDFRYRLFYLFLCANNIPFCTLFSDPVASPTIGAKSIHQPEENLIVRIDSNPYNALGTHIASHFLDHSPHQHLALFAGCQFPAIVKVRKMRAAHSIATSGMRLSSSSFSFNHTLDKRRQSWRNKDRWLVLKVVTATLNGGGFSCEDAKMTEQEQEEEGDPEKQAYSMGTLFHSQVPLEADVGMPDLCQETHCRYGNLADRAYAIRRDYFDQ